MPCPGSSEAPRRAPDVASLQAQCAAPVCRSVVSFAVFSPLIPVYSARREGGHHLAIMGTHMLFYTPEAEALRATPGGAFGLKFVTDKQAVIDALQRLPEDISIEEITEELRIMTAIRRGRADITAGRTRTQEEAERSPESRATALTSR